VKLSTELSIKNYVAITQSMENLPQAGTLRVKIGLGQYIDLPTEKVKKILAETMNEELDKIKEDKESFDEYRRIFQ